MNRARAERASEARVIHSLVSLYVLLGLAWFVLMLGMVAAIRQASR